MLGLVSVVELCEYEPEMGELQRPSHLAALESLQY